MEAPWSERFSTDVDQSTLFFTFWFQHIKLATSPTFRVAHRPKCRTNGYACCPVYAPLPCSCRPWCRTNGYACCPVYSPLPCSPAKRARDTGSIYLTP